MDKIKKYIEAYIPTETCNLRCHYCYIAQQRKFNNKLAKFEYEPEYIAKVLSKERLGGPCLINLCAGGETLLVQELLPIVKALLQEGHYVMIVTNGTLSVRFDEIAKFPRELLERLFFKFSFHYLELKRINKLDEFFDNINKMKQAGASFTVEVTPNDELIPYIPEIKEICMEKLGALCHITIARDDRKKEIPILSKYSFDEYKKIWGQFDSKLFEYKTTIYYKKRKEFCYGGDWMLCLNLATGETKQCYCGTSIQNIYEDINEPIKAFSIGNNCPIAHCYNGHSFIPLGCIPELDAPTYAELRNRVCLDGTEWLNEKMKSFMNTKLFESNEQYDDKKKKNINSKNIRIIRYNKVKGKIKRIIRRKK